MPFGNPTKSQKLQIHKINNFAVDLARTRVVNLRVTTCELFALQKSTKTILDIRHIRTTCTMSSIFDFPTTTNTVLLGVAIVLGLAPFVLGKRDRQKKKKPWPSVDGALPIVGNLLQLKGSVNLVNRMEEWAEEYSKETGCFEVNLAGTRYVVICSEERMKEVLMKRPNKVIRHPKMAKAVRGVGADGVFVSEGSKWQADRRLVAPCFNHNQIRDYLPHVKTVLNRLLHKWKQQAKVVNERGETLPITINNDIFAYTMDSTGLTVFGLDFDCLRTSGSVEAKDFLTLLGGVSVRALSPIPFWNIPFVGQYLDGLGWARQRLTNRMNEKIEEQIRGEQQQSSSTFIQKTIDYSLKDASFNRSHIVGNMLTIVFAATDSTMSTHMTAVQKLAEDKTGLQQELLEEINQALPRDLSDVSLEDLQPEKLPKLKAFLYEVLRWYSPFPFMLLQANEAIPFCGTTLEKGTAIFTLLRYVSKNPHAPAKNIPLGPNGEPATEYCPRRFWKRDNGGKVTAIIPPRNSTSYLAFGHGSRVCLGKSFSEETLTLTLATLIKTFEMKLAPNHAPIGRIKMLAEVPDIDVRVMFRERVCVISRNDYY